MAIFPKIEAATVVQVSDKFRIDCTKTYISKGEAAITLVRVEPEEGAGFINITGAAPIQPKNWFLDWEYSSPGEKIVTLEVTTDGAPVTVTHAVECLSEVDDKLFSTDQDLVAIEHNVTKYVPDGRASFKYLHREAQKQILEWLWINGYRGPANQRLTKENIIDVDEVRFWSKYMVLRLLYRDLSNSTNDVNDQKSKLYEVQEHRWREIAGLKLDVTGDGTAGAYEGFNLTSRELVRE
jgi:hypothetical protein